MSNVVKNTSLEIQDSAEIFNISWYEVCLKSQTNINNKGWIKKDSIITIDDTVNNKNREPYLKNKRHILIKYFFILINYKIT